MKSKLKKILFIVLSLVVVLSSCVLPSFAWSLEENGDKVAIVEDVYTIYFEGETEIPDGDGYYYYYGLLEGEASGAISLSSSNLWRDTLIRCELKSYGGQSSGTCYVTPTGDTPRSWDYSSSGYVKINADTTLLANTIITLTLSQGKTLSIELRSTVPYNGYSAQVKLQPDAEYIVKNFNSNLPALVDQYQKQIVTLQGEVADLEEIISEKNHLISGLENNNVLDGALSGVGEGFANMITPLLSLGVGGVTLGSVIGVLLIIGVILLFVFLINKIRGA